MTFNGKGMVMRKWAMWVVGLFCVAMIGGCGVARSASLQLLAADNAPPPPAGTLVNREISTLLLQFTYPTITVFYTTPCAPDKVVEYYLAFFKAKGWEKWQDGDVQRGVPFCFGKPEMQLKLRVSSTVPAESGGSTNTHVTLLIETMHPWEFALFSWVQNAILFLSIQGGSGAPDPDLLKFIGLF